MKLKIEQDELYFEYRGCSYKLFSHPYDPCLYIMKDEQIFRAIRMAFEVSELIEAFSVGGTVHSVVKDAKEHDEESFCRVLAAVIDSNRFECDFPYAESIVK